MHAAPEGSEKYVETGRIEKEVRTQSTSNLVLFPSCFLSSQPPSLDQRQPKCQKCIPGMKRKGSKKSTFSFESEDCACVLGVRGRG